jgi:putative Mg2+ transporter-C (MgtC) family protein
VRGLTTAASIWATCSLGVAVGVGRYLLAVGATVLVGVTLGGLRAARDLLRRWAVSREEFTLMTRGSFDLEQVAELARREGVSVRGLDREPADGGDRVVLVARLPRRYPPERLLEALTRFPHVREVEWDG